MMRSSISRAFPAAIEPAMQKSQNGNLTTKTLLHSLILSLTLIVALFISVHGRDILPSTYYNDDSLIQRLIEAEAVIDDGSFFFMARFYTSLGLGAYPTLAALLALSLFVVAIFQVVSWSQLTQERIPILLLVGGAMILGSVYLAQYSKEILVIVLILMFNTARRHWSLELLWLLLAALYAHLVRDYWYLIIILYIAIRLAITIRATSNTLLASMLIGYFVLVISFPRVLGVPLVHYRRQVQQYLDASTMIVDPPFGDALLLQYLGILVVLGGLLVPIPLILLAQPVYVILAAYLLLLWVNFGRPIFGRTDFILGNPGIAASVSFVSAFVMVQSIYEPDYGSYVKHLLPIFPIILSVVVSQSPRRITDSPRLITARHTVQK